MYPNLLGFEDSSYIFMIVIGVIAAIAIALIYMRKIKYNVLDLILCAIGAVLCGLIFAILFENLYEAIEHAYSGKPQSFTPAMTFFGGLFGGALGFLLIYFLYYEKHNEPIIKGLLLIAPCCICTAHGIGRLGCFLAGCCYGLPTDAWYGVQFPGMTGKVIPTQLFEMIFLLLLAIILGIFAFKKVTVYTLPIYMFSYSIFRFVIEFYRGDERGQLPGLSPSQYWCLIMFIGAIVLIYFYNKKIFPKVAKNEI